MTAAAAKVPEPTAETSALRQMFGQFASGVTVIASGPAGDVHAMTANAFMSVSLDPPLALISLQNGCRMRRRIDREGRFGVSILAADQAAESDHFAGRHADCAAPSFIEQAAAPVLAGALAWMSCSVEQRLPAGDHTLFIARVDDFDQTSGAPLLFYGGAYRTLNQESTSQ